jgi:hypothetical protein
VQEEASRLPFKVGSQETVHTIRQQGKISTYVQGVSLCQHCFHTHVKCATIARSGP